jgi:hypothetical protein
MTSASINAATPHPSAKMRRLGWTLFGLMWLPIGAAIFGMMGMPAGDYAWEELPLITRYGTIAFAALCIPAMSLLVGATVVGGLKNRQVLSSGLPAKAIVLELRETGTTINKHPVVGFVLEVHPEGGEAFTAQTERLVPRLQIPQIQPGAVLNVMYDPHTKAVAIRDAS